MISAFVSLNGLDMKLFTQLSCKAHCRSASASGGPSETPRRHTQMKGTDSRRIRPDITPWLSVFEKQKGQCEATLAEGGKLLKRILIIFIWRGSGRSYAWRMTVWVWSQNCLVIPRSRTCNLSKVTISYKLWGGDPISAKKERAGVTSCAIWRIKKSRASDSNGASRWRKETCLARSTWWWPVIETERCGCVTGDNSSEVFRLQTCVRVRLYPCHCQS